MENRSRSECFLTASLHSFAAPSSFLTFKASLLPICTTSLQSSPSLIMPWFITTVLSTVFFESAVVFLLFHFNPLCGLPKPLRSSLLLVVHCDNDIIGKAFSPSSLLLSVNGVNVICAHGRAKMSRDKTFFSICEIFGLMKDSWVVDYFRLSWNLFVDLWIKPGFQIAFSIWKTFKSVCPWDIDSEYCFFFFHIFGPRGVKCSFILAIWLALMGAIYLRNCTITTNSISRLDLRNQ